MDFIHWYIATLRSLVPGALRRPGGRDAAVTVTAAAGAPPAAAEVTQEGRGGGSALGRLGQMRRSAVIRPVVLRLRGAGALIRRVTLPAAARRDLAAALAFEIDRLTPFTAEEVLVAHEIVARDPAQGLLHVRLAVLPRAWIAGLLAALGEAGFAAVRIEAAGTEGEAVFALPGARRQSRVPPALALLAAALAGLCLAIPPARQALALHRLATARDAIAPQVRLAEALRARLAAEDRFRAALGAEAAREGDMLRMLAALTSALPDRSYLTDLSLRDRVATLDGESPNAAGLIARLAADPHFADPAFAAPVTRSLNGNGDVFSIRVRLRDDEAG
ncbi:unnamed protein product [Acidocella sp. C78]|uniref:PilN domain-containing protein n=1 Tax=Acidocella sp. C78 TaxID=1671486 RepID=UPI00191BB133|nr:PilN domain-containing protein [Acidocella sp. C78]CAG4914586.1 unnamed protein product [Acidocella sp. C78]